MRIGLDTRLILHTPRHGGANYVYELARHLPAAGKDFVFIYLYSYLRNRDRQAGRIAGVGNYDNVEKRIANSPWRYFLLNYVRFLPLDLFFGQADLIHTPFCSELVRVKTKWVVTIHQVTEKKYRHLEAGLPGIKSVYDMLEKISGAADRIITDTLYTKNILVSEYNCPENKVDTVYLSASELFAGKKKAPEKSAIPERSGLHSPYILFSGSANWNKNLPVLLKAFKSVSEREKDINLVLAGSPTWNYLPLSDLVRNLGLENRVILPGFVPEEDLVILYRKALFFVMPSLVEGFGISVLEAMKCSLPLLLSEIPVFREVAGAAAIYFNPENSEELAEKMFYLLRNPAVRTQYAVLAEERGRFFSWQKTAEETLRTYRKTIE